VTKAGNQSPKGGKKRVTKTEKIKEMLEYVVSYHEWCDQPTAVDPRCGERHYMDCYTMRSISEMCEGCQHLYEARKLVNMEDPESPI